MEEIIKLLEAKRDELELKIRKINQIILGLEELEELKVFPKKEPKKKREKEGRGGRPKKYPLEMIKFIERHMNQNSNKQLCKLIKEKYNVEITEHRLSPYMNYHNLKRGNPNRQREERKGNEIIDFIRSQKNKGVYDIRDAVIEKFEKNLHIKEIKMILNGELSLSDSKEKSVAEILSNDNDINNLELG